MPRMLLLLAIISLLGSVAVCLWLVTQPLADKATRAFIVRRMVRRGMPREEAEQAVDEFLTNRR